MPKLIKGEYDKRTEDIESAFRSAMAMRRISQAKLAKKLKISQSMVSKRLSNIEDVKLSDIREIAKELGVSITVTIE